MKRLVLLFVAIMTVGLISVSGQIKFAPCAWERKIGVEIKPQGFVSSVEAERFTATLLDWHFRDPQSQYCVIAAAGPAERRMVIKTSHRVLETGRGQESIKKQAMRTGGAILVEEVSRRLPSRTRTIIRRSTRQFTREPRIRVAQVLVSVEAWMYGSDREVSWKGIYSHYFTVEEKTENYNKSYRVLSGESFGELAPYKDAGAVDVPLTAVFSSEKRMEQLMKLWVLRRALEKENVYYGGEELLAQRTP